MTIEAFYAEYTAKLKTIYDDREAGNIANLVFEAEGIKRIDRITDKQKPLNHLSIQSLNVHLRKLLQNMPVQYVLGEAYFYKMKFKVNKNVLIPRPETEELIEWVVKQFKMENEKKSDGLTILDIGTGSGCIPIALKKELPQAEIYSIDISANALQIAAENANDHNTKIEFIKLDFLDETQWQRLASFDIIVSNPPYIPHKERYKMEKHIIEYEPAIALFVPDRDPFIFYKKIAAFSKSHLNNGGRIFVEVHEDHAKEIQEIFSRQNFTTNIKKDMYGKERMVEAY
ncbi:MAG: peptide chain release factor N(5)-glutamine methyltransferase [Chitinophagaceae bacterium]|nr:peptide chain release factor N(5)-glutamine methyltransferase [Chitinophagaceae bacterium]